MPVFEILREYVLHLEGLNHVVKGRVSRLLSEEDSQQYLWEISHHCKPSENAATVYRPSVVSAETFEDAARLLLRYMNAFTSISVTPNQHY